MAVELPEALRSRLADLQDALRGIPLPVRWARPDGVHLTLKFLGEVAADRLPAVESALAGMDDAWPANYNTPTQTVIAGTMTGLEAAAQRLQRAGAKRVIPLNVSAAFHTPLMAPAAERLRAALDRIEWRAPRIPVMANLTGRPHHGGDRIPHVMEMQLRSPVRWAACVATLVELGCDTFIEVGPKRALTGMMRDLAPGKNAVAVGTPAACLELAIPA